MAVEVWFMPTVRGEYEIACTELCGLGHYQMKAFLHLMSEEEFGTWMAGEIAKHP